MTELRWGKLDQIEDITSPKIAEIETMTRFTGLVEPLDFDIKITPPPVPTLKMDYLNGFLDSLAPATKENYAGGYTGSDDYNLVGVVPRPNHAAPQRPTVTFYRVEDHSGQGPYRLEVDYPLTNGRFQHPLPQQDGIDWWSLPSNISYVFGFSDLTDLLGWFDSDALRRLLNARNERWQFRVTRYEVVAPEKIIHGYRQAIAKRDDLLYREDINIADLI